MNVIPQRIQYNVHHAKSCFIMFFIWRLFVFTSFISKAYPIANCLITESAEYYFLFRKSCLIVELERAPMCGKSHIMQMSVHLSHTFIALYMLSFNVVHWYNLKLMFRIRFYPQTCLYLFVTHSEIWVFEFFPLPLRFSYSQDIHVDTMTSTFDSKNVFNKGLSIFCGPISRISHVKIIALRIMFT